MYDQRISTAYLKSAIEYYNKPSQWWNLHNKWDAVSVLFADTDDKTSKIVMLNNPGQLLNDTRVFQDIGQMAVTRGYAPNNCNYKVGKDENVMMLYKDGKSGDIVLKDTGTKNYNQAKNQAAQLYRNKGESTNEIWLVNVDQRIYNIYKDTSALFGYLEVLGQWIYEQCPDYQSMHPTDNELGLKTVFGK